MILLLYLYGLMAITFAQDEFTVVLDPGHGGVQNGAMIGTTREADIVLDIAKRVERILLQDEVRVLLTRENDVDISLSQRASFANEQNALDQKIKKFIHISINNYSKHKSTNCIGK